MAAQNRRARATAVCASAETTRTSLKGAYAGLRRDEIIHTLGLLRHFRAFLKSNCKEMRDPYELAWFDGASRLDKAQAAKKLTWLVHMAINRKAGITDYPMNHRGKWVRRSGSDYWASLRRDFYRLKDIHERRLRVYQFETEEVRSRFSHLLASYED